MPRLLPLRPRPHGGELLSSWFMRLAHANAQGLPSFSFWLTGDPNFWVHDPDRFLRPGVALALSEVTGVPVDDVQRLTLTSFEGQVFPELPLRAPRRWVMPLYKRGYRRRRPGMVFCPACLRDAPFLRREWRLSFMTVCPAHGTGLLDACPACRSPFAPLRNDLGAGQDWSLQPELPFAFCPECGADLRRVHSEAALPATVAFQARLLGAARGGVMAWPGEGEVPALEGFDVLHQLTSVVLGRELQAHLVRVCGQPGPARVPERPNRTFEDFDLPGRGAILAQVAFLVEDWPERFTATCRLLELTRRPLVLNFRPIPPWYDAVADGLSRANGRRAPKHVPLVPHLTLEEMNAHREGAPTALERRRWDVLIAYAQQPEKRAVARALGVSWDLVHATVSRYNASGPAGLELGSRGRPNRKKRLLSAEQEEELQAALRAAPMTNAQLADWMEAQIGRRPDGTTLWIYRRGIMDHSRAGRRAKS